MELKISYNTFTRYPRNKAARRNAGVNKREQQLYPGYLAQLGLKDTEIFHTHRMAR